MEALIQAFRQLQAEVFIYYTKAHGFHWNVEGIHFQELHALFETIYTEVLVAIDPFAENIRKLGGYAPGNYTRFSMLTQIEDETQVPPKDAMVQELLADCEKVCKILKLVYDLAEREGKHGLSNCLAERMDAHDKYAWMLRASLK